MTTYPKSFDGRQTTKEEWDRYEHDLFVHNATIELKRLFLERILMYANEYGIENARNHFKRELDQASSMDAPNKPGYYRANND